MHAYKIVYWEEKEAGLAWGLGRGVLGEGEGSSEKSL